MKTKKRPYRELTNEEIDYKLLVFNEAIKAGYGDGVPLGYPEKGEGLMYGHGVYRNCRTRKLEYGDYALDGSIYFAPLYTSVSPKYLMGRIALLNEEKLIRTKRRERIEKLKQLSEYMHELSSTYGEIDNLTLKL